MIIAGPNLTIDRTLAIDEIRPGEVLRFSSAEVTPGGKGVNVARVARAVQAHALLIGFVPGATGRAVAELIGGEGLTFLPVPGPGQVRSTAIVLERSGRVTVFNEPGPEITGEDWEAYEDAVRDSMEGHRVLVCSGSLPPGSPPDAYARLTRVARAEGALALVDSGGSQLHAALEAGADFVVPNLAEAEGLLHGRSVEDVEVPAPEARDRATAAAQRLATTTLGTAIVTAGSAGLAVARGEASWWVDAPEVEVRNPIGAGDSFAAGLAAALEQGAQVLDAVVAGIGAAAASVETVLAGGIDADRAAALADLTRTAVRRVTG